MKLSEVFARTKTLLLSPKDTQIVDALNKPRCICLAISQTAAPKEDRVRAAKVIEDRLNGYIFLEAWVAGKIGHEEYSRHRSRSEVMFRRKMQTTRHAWLDSLIAEFAAKGD